MKINHEETDSHPFLPFLLAFFVSSWLISGETFCRVATR